ncbi:hypothetical protein PMAYCL1PPCAC_24405 [Pristionchus mayeri]|uniref:Uncharacterized protein n=1 Tax=Pristionchus mayeri TaxID=1317129 RepID=A0AAN5I7N0_9BILA|nr:hypothetical protein PMAYCL1PPCAC_24405 [Pristionchus mayeri]
MSSLCLEGIINLGYIGDYFPVLFKEGTRLKGLSLLLFEDVAWKFNCSSLRVIEFYKFSSLAAVQRGEILTDITTSTLSRPRMEEFHYSDALYVDMYSFYEATNHVSGEAWTPLQFFVVYDPFPLLLIFLSLILIEIITQRNQILNTSFGLCMKYVTSGFFLISILFILLIHGAVFKGNTIYPNAASVT